MTAGYRLTSGDPDPAAVRRLTFVGFLPDGRCLASVRKLGIVKLKGLEPLAVYELVDGGPFPPGLQPLASADLTAALERDYANALTEASSVQTP